MKLPSLELLSAVLKVDIELIEKEDNLIIYTSHHCPNPLYDKSINIYELGDKLKKWAWNNGYTLNTIMKKSHITNKLCFKVIIEPTEYAEYSLVGDEEFEAIIAACEWILEQITKIKDN